MLSSRKMKEMKKMYQAKIGENIPYNFVSGSSMQINSTFFLFFCFYFNKENWKRAAQSMVWIHHSNQKLITCGRLLLLLFALCSRHLSCTYVSEWVFFSTDIYQNFIWFHCRCSLLFFRFSCHHKPNMKFENYSSNNQ